MQTVPEALAVESGGAGPTAEERSWAAMAHATAVVALVVGLATGGLGVLLTLLLPLAIYLAFRERSRYVAFHALQSAAFQALGGLALILLALGYAGSLVLAWVLTGLLSLVVVGVLLIPLALLVTIVGGLAVLAGPFGLAGWALYGAYEVYQGRPFEYRWVGDLVARNMDAEAAGV